MLNKILLIDKPKQWTSFDVVAKVRGAYSRKYKELTGEKRRVKVGHTGTLDPLATGLLIIAAGKATKTVPELIKVNKTYNVELTLGITSTTGDGEGEKTAVSSMVPEEEVVTKVLSNFVGKQQQTPPSYSAIKVNGKRAYELARKGQEVKLEPRSIEIFEITKAVYTYPIITLTTTVSSGTYIRSLVEDIGKKLDTGAYMSNLRRTAVGEYSIDNAETVDDAVERIESLESL